KTPTPKTRSTATRTRAMATTGVPSRKMMLVAYIDHRNSGRRNQVMPGARMRWMVATKFRPVRIDEKPGIRMPRAVASTWGGERGPTAAGQGGGWGGGAGGRGKGPGGAPPAAGQRPDG